MCVCSGGYQNVFPIWRHFLADYPHFCARVYTETTFLFFGTTFAPKIVTKKSLLTKYPLFSPRVYTETTFFVLETTFASKIVTATALLAKNPPFFARVYTETTFVKIDKPTLFRLRLDGNYFCNAGTTWCPKQRRQQNGHTVH